MSATATPRVEPYTKLANRLLKNQEAALRALPPLVRLFYCILVSYALWKGPLFFVSQPKLADEVGVSVRSIRRYTKQLEAAGLRRVHMARGLPLKYELLGDLWKTKELHQGQPVRIPHAAPRTARPYAPRHRGQAVPDQLRLTEPTPPETRQNNAEPAVRQALADPWARFRSDPLVLTASQAGCRRPP